MIPEFPIDGKKLFVVMNSLGYEETVWEFEINEWQTENPQRQNVTRLFYVAQQ